ncbi:unnamed protein product [Closterium sp. NIES-65]|nr:unnamed protein product [Closterium sp. NIES-65]
MTCPLAQPAVSMRHAAEMRGWGEEEAEKDALGSFCAASGAAAATAIHVPVTGAATAAVRVECGTRSMGGGAVVVFGRGVPAVAVPWILAMCLLFAHGGVGDALVSARSHNAHPTAAGAAAAGAAAAHTSTSSPTSSSFHRAPSTESGQILPPRHNNPASFQPNRSPLPPPLSPPAAISTTNPTLLTTNTPNPTISFRLPLSRKTMGLPDIVPEQSSNQGTLTNQIQFNTQIAEAKGGKVEQNNSQAQAVTSAAPSSGGVASAPAPAPCSDKDKKCKKEQAKEELARDTNQLHRDVGQVGQDVRQIGQDVAQWVPRTPLDLTYTFPAAPDYRRTFAEVIPEGADGIFVSFPGGGGSRRQP